MPALSTSEILKEYEAYVESASAKAAVKSFSAKYEKYIQENANAKELFKMDVDELFDMIIAIIGNKSDKESGPMTAHFSYDQTASLLRSIFDFYNTIADEKIPNPLKDKRMKGFAATDRLAQGCKPLCWNDVQNIINRLHDDLHPDFADYIELILRLFYSGFANAEEIVDLQQDMITNYSRRNKVATINGRDIDISGRCTALLDKFCDMHSVRIWRRDYTITSWRDSYFRFFTTPGKENELSERPKSKMCDIINRYISINVSKKYDVKLNYYTLYLLGFFEQKLVKDYGENEAKRLITSYRSVSDAEKLKAIAEDYGINVSNISKLKKHLRMFISTDKQTTE